MAKEPVDPLRIDGSPTKDFFINMLIKDIILERSILDLADNCIDGAKRTRGAGSFKNLFIHINFDTTRFEITDNCGGIPIKQAREYAFRFGRPENATPTKHSWGLFGVGMKRALFKLGGTFKIESSTPTSSFTVDIDVAKWKQEKEWNFKFSELKENISNAPEVVGTKITITLLHDSVKEQFKLENFESRLNREVAAALQETLEREMEIRINDTQLKYHPLELLASTKLVPANVHFEVKSKKLGGSVGVKIYTGVGGSEPEDAGWYVFCNGRLVLEHDQTIVTGWGEKAEKTLPKYHNQFARFRGFVFFDSAKASLLPWNTTKTGIDGDSPLYKGVKQKMVRLMRPVIDFLNALDAEKKLEKQPLLALIEAATPLNVRGLKKSSKFVYPATTTPVEEATVDIKYSKPRAIFEEVAASLNTESARKVGEKTFEYYVKQEIE